MTIPSEPTVDILADATLTPEQRRGWNVFRAELNQARTTVRDLEKRIRELEHQQAALEPAVILTRPEFNREVARMLAFDERYGGTSSVLYFDIENMDDINERYGKSVVNAAVREITNTLIASVRGADIIGRLAPEEFGVLLVRCSNADAWKKGKDLAAKLSEVLAEVHGCMLEPRISYGAYTFRENEDVASGLKEASQVMTKVTIRQ